MRVCKYGRHWRIFQSINNQRVRGSPEAKSFQPPRCPYKGQNLQPPLYFEIFSVTGKIYLNELHVSRVKFLAVNHWQNRLKVTGNLGKRYWKFLLQPATILGRAI